MDPQRRLRVSELLLDNIRQQLRSAIAARGLSLDAATLDEVARDVAAEVQYAFDVDWKPDWVGPDSVHSWQENGTWFARCSECLMDSPPSTSRDDAEFWARHHPSSSGHSVAGEASG